MKYLIKKIVIVAFFLLVNSVFSQSFIKGKIVNENGIGLNGTTIVTAQNQINAISNLDGFFKVDKEGVYTFQKKGYQTKTIELKRNQFYIIQLSMHSLELDEIIVTSNHIPQKLKKATASIAIISSDDIQRFNNTDFAPILNRATGVFMQSGALNTNRITIRGVGSRNLFGTSKIRAYFKDIPLTNGSGQTTIEDFELASIANFEIIKGAASSIYGAGLGGVIHLNPQNVFLNNSNINSELSVGSFGLIKGVINVNHSSEKNGVRAVYSNTKSDGYRENNDYHKQTFTISANHFFNEKDELTFLASYVDLKAFIPSSINEDAFINKPKSAAFTWKQAKGFEDSQRAIFGLSWNHSFKDNLKLVTSVFTSLRENYEPRPFNILAESTVALGIRTRLLGTHQLFDNNVKWTVGAEIFNDIYTWQTFENLYENSPLQTGSVQGNILSNFKENRSYYNVFAEGNYEFSENTAFSIGLNLNRTWYILNDRFGVSENNPDQSGEYSFNTIISPKIGLSHMLSENISLFSSISHGFSPISLEETLLPDGEINTGLKPETGWNFEMGSRGNFFNNRLFLNVSIYRLNIKNLVVSRRTAQDQFVGINAGKTEHNGLESEMRYKWLTNKKLSINTFVNFTVNNFIFKEFIDNENDFSGNDLTGVPSSVFNAGVDFTSDFGFYGNINYQFVGSIPITDANSLYSNSYQLTNTKVGYLLNFNKKLSLNLFLGINNLFDEKYASQILINASGFGGNAPRYFYPGNPFNYFSGINLNYVF